MTATLPSLRPEMPTTMKDTTRGTKPGSRDGKESSFGFQGEWILKAAYQSDVRARYCPICREEKLWSISRATQMLIWHFESWQ